MLAAWRRFVPYLLVGFLVLNLIEAIQGGGRDDWLIVGITAAALAFLLWQRSRAPRE